MANRKNRIIRYALKNRSYPSKNRRRVGQSLILLTVFIFFVFLINFAIIIGTDTKFGQNLSEGAARVHRMTVTKQAKRGTIYDRTGMPIAQDSTTYTIYAIIDKDYVSALKEPLYVQSSQFDKVAEILNKKLGMKKEFVIQQLNLPNLSQVYFGTAGKNISYSTMTEIQSTMKKAGVKGINFDTSPGRMYPNGNFASIFVGLAQLADNDDGSQSLVGQTGMESALNGILSGQDGEIVYEKDSKGRILPDTADIKKETIDGQDVYTTLSADLQRSLETNMDVFYKDTKAVNASATLVSAKTGEILATTQRPTFDADTKEGLSEKDFSWLSLLYQSQYEPGSTMKVMTLAAAIDSGKFKPNEVYYNDKYDIADATIKDWTVNTGREPQYLNYAQGFALSSNVGMTRLEQAMGDDLWLHYLSKFRYGFPTRFGMTDESGGMLPEENIVSYAMTSFGQAINVTHLQMLRSFNAIANDGVMLEPKFITGTYDPNTDTSRVSQKEVVGNPVSADAARQTRNYMIAVGTDPYYGTLYSKAAGGAVITVDGYDIAVKSGTAQIAKLDGTGYMEGNNDYINSVVAMIPAEDPQFIMYVTLQQPTNFTLLSWQSIVNPVLKEAMLLKDSLNLDTPAQALTTVIGETEYKLGNIVGQSPGTTADDLRRHLVQPVILGNGSKIKKVSVKEDSNVSADQQILLLTTDFTELPDMYGWTKENVKIFEKWTGIEITYQGSGDKVTAQSSDTGTSLKKLKKLTITLGE
ncbi:penicillin-binding protein PBP2X [Streptococcus gallolyticus]|nr:penicillin-binding protein PBP2X [Streptococcus gallolyticus]MBY5040202.1 penicillin-binding protein PBP2X [Streptococcus gallolyticus]